MNDDRFTALSLAAAGGALIAHPMSVWAHNPDMTQMQVFLDYWWFMGIGGLLLVIASIVLSEAD